MTELKPCPFCGGKAHTLKNNAGHYAYCTKCLNGTSYYGTRELAIKAWNTRPDSWHTGTPTEEGWYLLAVKHGEKIHYNANRLYSGGEWFYSKLGEVLAYQKIEPYEASKERK